VVPADGTVIDNDVFEKKKKTVNPQKEEKNGKI